MNKAKRIVSIMLASCLSCTPAFAMYSPNAQPGFSEGTRQEERIRELEGRLKKAEEEAETARQKAAKEKQEQTAKHRKLMCERLRELQNAQDEIVRLKEMLDKSERRTRPPYDDTEKEEVQRLREEIEEYRLMKSAYLHAQDEVDRMSEKLQDCERHCEEQEITIADLIAQIEQLTAQLTAKSTRTEPTDDYIKHLLETKRPMLATLADKLLSDRRARRFCCKCAINLPLEKRKELVTTTGDLTDDRTKLINFLDDVLTRGLQEIILECNRHLPPSSPWFSVHDSAPNLIKAISMVQSAIPEDRGNYRFKDFLEFLISKLTADDIIDVDPIPMSTPL